MYTAMFPLPLAPSHNWKRGSLEFKELAKRRSEKGRRRNELPLIIQVAAERGFYEFANWEMRKMSRFQSRNIMFLYGT